MCTSGPDQQLCTNVSPAPRLYKKLNEIAKYYDISRVETVILYAAFDVFFNSIISMLLLQALYIFDRFGETNLSAKNVLITLLTPLALVMLIVVVFVGVVVIVVGHRAPKMAKTALAEISPVNPDIAKTRSQALWVFACAAGRLYKHAAWAGVACYFVMGEIAAYLTLKNGSWFGADNTYNVSWVDYVLVGVLMVGIGGLWNLSAYWSFCCINWTTVVREFKDKELTSTHPNEPHRENTQPTEAHRAYLFRMDTKHTLANIVTAFALLGWLSYICIRTDPGVFTTNYKELGGLVGFLGYMAPLLYAIVYYVARYTKLRYGNSHGLYYTLSTIAAPGEPPKAEFTPAVDQA